jgi:hypothetical protein
MSRPVMGLVYLYFWLKLFVISDIQANVCCSIRKHRNMATEISAAQLIVTLKPAEHKDYLVGNKAIKH